MIKRLTELLFNTGMLESESRCKIAAKELIDNGVIVPPCKVGDKVYYINSRYEKQGRRNVHTYFVDEGEVDNITVGDLGIPQIDVCNEENEWIIFDSKEDFGEIVFLTREDAEKALKEGVQK